MLDLKDVVNHVIIMLERIMENLNVVRSVIKMLDQIKKFVLIALTPVIVQKNERI